MTGRSNVAIGRDNDIYGIDNYLEWTRNSATGLRNIGIGQNQ